MKLTWNDALHALVLIRIGQDLGTHSPAARAIHDTIELAVAVIGSFCR